MLTNFFEKKNKSQFTCTLSTICIHNSRKRNKTNESKNIKNVDFQFFFLFQNYCYVLNLIGALNLVFKAQCLYSPTIFSNLQHNFVHSKINLIGSKQPFAPYQPIKTILSWTMLYVANGKNRRRIAALGSTLLLLFLGLSALLFPSLV